MARHMKFTEHMNRLIKARERGDADRGIFGYNTKGAGRTLAAELDIPVPKIVVPGFEIGLMPEDPRASVVLKPNDGCSGHGVMPLERLETESAPYRLLWPDPDQADGQPELATRAEWQVWLEVLAGSVKWKRESGVSIGSTFFGEELIPPPEDVAVQYGARLGTVWKVYCIHGRPEWARELVVRDRREALVCCWWIQHNEYGGPSFRRLDDDVLMRKDHHTSMPLPAGPFLRVYDYARIIASELRERTSSPFVRVDLLEGPRLQVYFNEITPHPSGGRDVYRTEWDEYLGHLWSEGEGDG